MECVVCGLFSGKEDFIVLECPNCHFPVVIHKEHLRPVFINSSEGEVLLTQVANHWFQGRKWGLVWWMPECEYGKTHFRIHAKVF